VPFYFREEGRKGGVTRTSILPPHYGIEWGEGRETVESNCNSEDRGDQSARAHGMLDFQIRRLEQLGIVPSHALFSFAQKAANSAIIIINIISIKVVSTGSSQYPEPALHI
jgi:hypothetical protein